MLSSSHPGARVLTRAIGSILSSLPARLIALAIGGLLVTCFLLLAPSVSAQTPTNQISLNPQEATASAGQLVQINLDIEDAFDIGGFELNLNYDPTLLQLESADLGGFLGSTGRTVTPLTDINNTTGNASIGAFSFGAPEGPDGSGTLMILTFNALDPGTSPLTISNLIVTDTTGTTQNSSSTDGQIEISTSEPDPDPTPTPEPTPLPPGNATLSFAGSNSVTRNEVFELDVNLQSSEAVTGVDIFIQFNPQFLTAESVTSTNVLPDMIPPQINNGNGTIRFSLLTNDPDQPLASGSATLAHLEFTPKVAGDTTIIYDFTPGSTNDSNVISAATGQDILTEVVPHQLEIIDFPPEVIVQLQTWDTQDDHTLTATLTHNLDPEFIIEINTNNEGISNAILLDQSLLGETVTFTLKADTYLRRSVTLILQPQTNLLDFGRLPAGDLNNDGIINSLDLGILYEQWFTQNTGDLNRDGIINALDHWIMLQNFFLQDE